jgi:hypothetical protein
LVGGACFVGAPVLRGEIALPTRGEAVQHGVEDVPNAVEVVPNAVEVVPNAVEVVPTYSHCRG